MSSEQLRRPIGRRWYKRLQISLRGLVLLLVALALGMAYWWRPFEIEVVITQKSNGTPPAHWDSWAQFGVHPFADNDSFVIYSSQSQATAGAASGGRDPFGPATARPVTGYYRREVRGVRRTALGKLVQHGRTAVFTKGGQRIFEEAWQDGLRHGPYRMWGATGRLMARGQFCRGEKHGEWTVWSASSGVREEQEYDDGEPVGKWRKFGPGTPVGKSLCETTFENGRRAKCVCFTYERGVLHTVRLIVFESEGRDATERLFFPGEGASLVRDVRSESQWRRVSHYKDGARKREYHWSADDGTPVGQWHWWRPDGTLVATVDFEDGQAVRIDGEPIAEFAEPPDDMPDWARRCLNNALPLAFSDATLDEIFSRIEPEVLINTRALASIDFNLKQRFSLELADLPLRVGVVLFLRQCGLVCDYRAGHLVATTEQDSKAWKGRTTGLHDIRPPPGSALERLLNSERGVELGSVLSLIDEPGVRLDPRLLGPQPLRPVSIYSERIPFKYFLERLLVRESLICELDGDTLFIKPVE